MKETFNYPKATPTVNGTVLPTGSSAKKRKVAACSSPNCNSKTIVDMLPHSNSIVLTFLENKVSSTNTHNVFEIKVDDNSKMMYRTAATESDFRILDSRSFETLSKRLKPFVDWYNKTNTTPTVVQNFMASNETMVLAG